MKNKERISTEFAKQTLPIAQVFLGFCGIGAWAYK